MDRREFLAALAGAGAAAALGARARPAAARESKPVAETPVILEVAINGSTTKARNPLVPETVDEQIAEINACLDLGVTIIHSHSNQPNEDPKVGVQLDGATTCSKTAPSAASASISGERPYLLP